VSAGACELLAELVAIPSVSGEEGPAADRAQAELERAGVPVERLGHDLVARIGRDGPRLLLNSHLDTVPVGADWTRDPYAAAWEGERLYGRGSNDAKASVAAMIEAVIALHCEGDLEGQVLLALTTCEETKNTGMARVLEHIGRPDGAVTGEPTGLEVVRAQSGLAVLTAQWAGRSCHAAHVGRVEHANAILAAAGELAGFPACLTLEGAHPMLGMSTVAVTRLSSGERHNVVPDRAEAVFDARLAPPHTALDAVRAIEARLPKAKVGVRSQRLGAIETPEDHPLVQAGLRAAGRPSAVGSHTLSDMALLDGVACIKCGPGLSARSHTADEFVLRSEVEAGARFYRRFARLALEALNIKEVRS
jgi:acetylornithine deacetylase